MLYGASKVLQLQLQVGAYYYTLPLGEISPKILTWSFLGYSAWFQTFLGLAEFIPAVLILFRRTRLLGSLLMFPVLLNVVLINFALNLWSETKLIGGFLLGLNIVIIMIDWPKIKQVGTLFLKKEDFTNSTWIEFEKYFSFIALLSGLCFVYLGIYSSHNSDISDFVGSRQMNKSGSFMVESFMINGVNVYEASAAKIYFDVGNLVYLVYKDEKIQGQFTADKNTNQFTIDEFHVLESNEKIQGKYEILNENVILINAKRAGQNVEMRLKKSLSWN